MCIVIDSDTLSCVFNENNSKHRLFKPVKDWVSEGEGKVVLGGSTYKKELSKMPRYIGFINSLDKKRRVVRIPSSEVDEYEDKLKVKVPEKSFDDAHILAIVAISKCLLVCTQDSKSLKYLKSVDLYPKHCARPKFFMGSDKSPVALLCRENIADICK